LHVQLRARDEEGGGEIVLGNAEQSRDSRVDPGDEAAREEEDVV